MNIKVDKLRSEYKGEYLDISNVDPSPFKQFKVWFKDALHSDIYDPNAMILSTVDQNGMPSSRTVLLKAYDDIGFVFYTNYESRKVKELEENPRLVILFPWFKLSRQLIIQGTVERVSKMESFKYFLSRPFGSKLSSWVSRQSTVISSRSILEMKLKEMKEKFRHGKVPLPDYWGGLRIIPSSFEYWQGQPERLHDRIYYTLQNDGSWKIERLAP